MSESRRLRKKWTETELIVVVDMYFNGHLKDSHGHDEIAKCLGRYNPNTNSFNDGGVNQKLAEIKGYIQGTRQPRHPGGSIIGVVEQYRDNQCALRAAARAAWRSILSDFPRPVPQYIEDILAVKN